jgi:RNA recognition motif-containing protein
MCVNIFVGNLAFTVTEQDLRQLFEPYGAVDTTEVMTDRETSRPYGFGFVDMPERSTARAAIAGLHGMDLAGRALTVNEANLWAWHGEPSHARG